MIDTKSNNLEDVSSSMVNGVESRMVLSSMSTYYVKFDK